MYERLRAANAALCVADTDDGPTPSEATADWGYLRLRAVEYSAEISRTGRKTIRELFAGGGAFVYFKHEEAGTGRRFARQLDRCCSRSPAPAAATPRLERSMAATMSMPGSSSTGASGSRHRARSAPAPVSRVKRAGSSFGVTSSQRSGQETGAPGSGRTEYGATIVWPWPFWPKSM